MTQHLTVELAADEWTLLTVSNAATISFQNQGAAGIEIAATDSGTEPPAENQDGVTVYEPMFGERDLDVDQLSVVAGTANRVWARSAFVSGKVGALSYA